MRWVRRALRGLVFVVGIAVALALSAASATILYARSDGGREWLRGLVLAQARKALPGLDIGRIGGDYLREISIDDVSVRDRAGRRAVHVDRIAARFELTPLLRRTIRVRELAIARPVVLGRPDEDGVSNLARLGPAGPAQAANGGGGGGGGLGRWRVEIDRVRIDDGAVDVEAEGGGRVEISALSVDGRAHAGGGTAAADLRALRASARAAGVGARLAGRGRADFVETAGGGLALGDYDLRLAAGDVDVEALLPAGARTSRLALTLVARGHGVPLGEGSRAALTLDAPAARVAGLDVDRIHVEADSDGARWRLPRTVARATGARLAIEASGRGEHLTAAVEADLHAAGRAPFPALRGDGRLRARVRGDLSGRFEVTAEGDARGLAAGGFRLRAATLRGRAVAGPGSLRAPRVSLHVAAQGLRASPRAPAVDALVLDASSDGRSLRVEGTAQGARVQAALAAHGPLSGRAATITVERLALSYETRAYAQKLELARPAQIRYRAGDAVEVAPLEVRGVGHLLTGALTAAATYRLRPARDQPIADARLGLRRASIRGTDPVDADVHATLERGRATLALEARMAAGRLRLDAAAPVVVPRKGGAPRLAAHGPVAVRLQTDTIDLQKLPVLQRRLASVGVSGGKLGATVVLEGDVAAPTGTATLDVREASFRNLSGLGKDSRLRTIAGVGATLRLEAGPREAHLAGTLLLRGAGVLRFDGRAGADLRAIATGAPAGDAPLAATVDIPAFELASLGDVADVMRGVRGRLTGHVAVGGTVGRPTARGDIQVDGAHVDEVAFRTVLVHGELRDHHVDLAANLAQAHGGDLYARARVETRRDGPLTATLGAQNVDLGFARPFLAGVREIGGTLQATVEAGGTLAAPTVRGEAALGGGRLGLIGQPTFHDVKLSASLRPGRLDLTSLAFHSGKGKFEGKGWAILDGLRLLSLTFTGHADQLLVAISGQTGARIDGDLAVEAARRDAVIAGKVEVPRAVVWLPGLAVGGGRKLQSTSGHPDVRFVDPAALAAEERRERAAQARPRTVSLDLEAKAGPVNVRSKDLDLDVDAHLRLAPPKGQPDKPPVLTGTVRVGHGRIVIQGRRYDFERGDLTFDGGPRPNPALDIRLTRQFAQATVTIEILGTLEKPDLYLTSDPPIYDQTQIVGLIISGDAAVSPTTGKPFDATGAVASMVLGRLADQLAPQLGLDVLRVENVEGRSVQSFQSGAAPFGFSNTRVEVGKYVSERIYLSYAHIFGAPENSNVNEAHVEYRVTHRWMIETVFGDAGVGSIDALWTWRR